MKQKRSQEVDWKTIKVKNIHDLYTPVNMKEVWKYEEYCFTPWLAANIDSLNAVLGLNLEVVECEKSAGRYELDIFAQDSTGMFYAIENQFGQSDQTHIGKAPIYAANLNANGIIWIGDSLLPEHKKYYEWLNEKCADCDVYAIEVKPMKNNVTGEFVFDWNVVVSPDKSTREMLASARKAISSAVQSKVDFHHAIEDTDTDHAGDWSFPKNYAANWCCNNKTRYKNLHAWINLVTTNKEIRIEVGTDRYSESGEAIDKWIADHNITGLEKTVVEGNDWCRWQSIKEYEGELNTPENVQWALDEFHKYEKLFNGLK